jgi:putative acetyltransferase
MRVRAFQPGDAERLGIIFYRSVREAACHAYSREQVEAWAVSVPPASFYEEKARDGRRLLVTVDGLDRPVAYGDLEQSGHIDHLFCHPDAIGTGAASQLYDQLELQARDWRIERLFVEASEIARPFFIHKGFGMLRRNDFIMRGVPMHHYWMEKLLVGQA